MKIFVILINFGITIQTLKLEIVLIEKLVKIIKIKFHHHLQLLMIHVKINVILMNIGICQLQSVLKRKRLRIVNLMRNY